MGETIQLQIRLENIVRRCEGFCIKRKEFISITTYHSQRCFESKESEGYCKYFEERK